MKRKKQLLVYVSEEMHQKLREYCAKNRITATALVLDFLDKKLK